MALFAEQDSKPTASVSPMKDRSSSAQVHPQIQTLSLYGNVGGAFWSNGNEINYAAGVRVRW